MSSMSDKKLWTLISPDNKLYMAESPLKCAAMELKTRVPVAKQVENIHNFVFNTCALCDEKITGFKRTLAEGTVAEIGPVCLRCWLLVSEEFI